MKPQTIFVPSAVKSLLATIKSIQINLFPSFFHSIVVVGLMSCSIWYCDFSFFMYLVVLPTSLHTRCLDTFDYLWLNSKSGHLSFAVCDSIPSYLLCIERVDLNSIADETFNYVVVVENTDSISKPYYSSSYVQDYFPRLTRRHDDETRSEAFDDFGGERERERGGHLSKSVKSPQIALEGSGWSSF